MWGPKEMCSCRSHLCKQVNNFDRIPPSCVGLDSVMECVGDNEGVTNFSQVLSSVVTEW